MGNRLRALIIEDAEDDVLLLLRHLYKGGYEVEHAHITNAEELRTALSSDDWDIAFSDWTMPGFGALQAIALIRDAGLGIPIIIISGTIGEEKAVEAMRRGAQDFILKDSPLRLIPAVERELIEASRRREQREMSERLQRSEDALRHAEKLSALGQIAAGISHDMRNILNPLSLHLQLIKRCITRGQMEEVLESVGEMEQALKRGLETLDRLRDFSRRRTSSNSKIETIELNRIAHEAIELSRPRMASSKRKMCTICEEFGQPPPISGYVSDVLTATVNLVVNAIDALKEGGTIHVRTGEKDGYAFLEVSDSGPGIPPDILQRIFEPFFTTKGEDGTGLGLAMVQACMNRHSGWVETKSEIGQGTTFKLFFPQRSV